MLSDLDELPRATAIGGILDRGIVSGEVICLGLEWYAYYLNVRFSEPWVRRGPRLILAKDLRGFEPLRRVLSPTEGFGRNLVRQIKSSMFMGRWVKRILFPDAGWHFSWLGGANAVALKGSSISVHSNLPAGNKNKAWADERIQSSLADQSQYEIIEVDGRFPKFIQENPEIFEKYILGEQS